MQIVSLLQMHMWKHIFVFMNSVDDYSLLECDIMYQVGCLQSHFFSLFPYTYIFIFSWNLFFYCEAGGCRIFQMISNFLSNYMASQWPTTSHFLSFSSSYLYIFPECLLFYPWGTGGRFLWNVNIFLRDPTAIAVDSNLYSHQCGNLRSRVNTVIDE